ncbi:MAG: V-type ATP synthase subunit A [Candidatus Geothermarchaeales archaeon]
MEKVVLREGEIRWISGSVIAATGIDDIEIGEICEVGEEGLVGEVIRISGDEFTIQVYETTTGLKPGERVVGSGKRLVAELGPGLLNNTLDGIGRPLEAIRDQEGPFITRGVKVNTLPRDKKWPFKPTVKKGDVVEGGDIIGTIQETPTVEHRVLVPPNVRGEIVRIEEGDFTVDEPVGAVKTDEGEITLKLMQEWPVRIPRPFRPDGRLPLDKPLITGQRVIDTFFPIAKGGTASIPGGFGTGKTVMLHQLAKWSDAKVMVYIGCGERGNEMCEVLTDFPKLIDPYTGRPMMERTILIANTSNMPVAAREASIYMGVTIAEYFRDQGYDVALMADSTSRWAEALREISGRLEEMPAERGYPAYLPDKVAEFYERAGRTRVLGKPEREGSVSIIGAVSPPGGDFNEPVTIHTLRFTGIFWALDRDLAYSRHFPAIHWLKSYSLYVDRLLGSWATSFSKYSERLEEWWKGKHASFPEYRGRSLKLLSESSEIESIARIMGESALPDDQRLILLAADLIKEAFLRQFAYDEVDSFCDIEKQFLLLKMCIDFYDKAQVLVRNRVPIDRIKSLPQISRMNRAKEDKSGTEGILKLMREVDEELRKIGEEYDVSW